MGEHRRSVRRGEHREGVARRRFRIELARSAATFHAYRLALSRLGDEESLAKLALIPRIDVAGAERDNPPENFAFVVKLLRDDRQARRALLENDVCEETYRPWIIIERTRAGAGIMLPRLNASCHAGEDFFHPLDGVAAIDSAVRGLELRDGDSIGHGLALGALDEHGRATTPRRSYAPAGRQFDVLLWLHKTAQHAPDTTPASERLRIESALDTLGAHIGVKRPTNGWAGLHALLARAQGPEPAPEARDGDDPATSTLKRRRRLDHAEREFAPLPVHPSFDLIPTLALIARDATVDVIAHEGVVIEVNPSSNLRVSGAGRDVVAREGAPHDLSSQLWPVVRMIRDFRSKLRFSINTDDPGVFATSIESEYELLFQCLLQCMERNEAIDFIESCRVCGMETLQ